MAPGPPDKFSQNRFSVLGDYIDIPPKKQKRAEYPELPMSRNKNNDPKYVIISPTDPKAPLTNISPFVIKKGIENISTEYISISLLRDGNLLILTRNTRVSEKFIRAKSLSNICPISCKLHETLNSVKGVIYAPCLINVPEKEIIQEMSDQAVTGIYKFTKPSDDGKSRVPTGKMIITFDLYRLPTSVDVAWYKCKVDHYIPNPMRCKTCQKLGHTKNRCKGNPTCPTCNLPPHEMENCTRTFCANCSGDHSSLDTNCPRYTQMKEILTIKTKEYCSISEARRKYKEKNANYLTLNNTYASTVNYSPTKRKDATKNSPENNKETLAPTHNETTTLSTTIKQTNESYSTLSTQKPTPKFNETTLNKNKATKPSSPTNLIEENTPIKTSTPNYNNNTENRNSITTSLMSLISQLTQNLIKKNNYYIAALSEDNPEETTTNPPSS